jgi:hypothetical protein
VSYDFIRAELKPHFEALSRCGSTAELLTLPLYRDLEPQLRRVLLSPDVESYARVEAAAKDRYCVVAFITNAVMRRILDHLDQMAQPRAPPQPSELSFR